MCKNKQSSVLPIECHCHCHCINVSCSLLTSCVRVGRGHQNSTWSINTATCFVKPTFLWRDCQIYPGCIVTTWLITLFCFNPDRNWSLGWSGHHLVSNNWNRHPSTYQGVKMLTKIKRKVKMLDIKLATKVLVSSIKMLVSLHIYFKDCLQKETFDFFIDFYRL